MAPFQKFNNFGKGRRVGSQNKTKQYLNFNLDIYDKEPLVYLFKANNRYKIGMTSNLKKRFINVQAHCPYLLELVWTLRTKDYKKLEKSLHNIYKNKRIHFEWFLLSDDDVNEIMSVTEINDLMYISGLFK
jgi:hypothetical protein